MGSHKSSADQGGLRVVGGAAQRAAPPRTQPDVRENDGSEAALDVSRDITDRADALLALRDAEERSRRSFDEAPIGIAMLAADGAFAKVNRALCAMTGLAVGELLSSSLTALAQADLRAGLEQMLRRMRTGELASHAGEVVLLDGSGKPLHISLHLSVMRDADGRFLHLLAHLLDVSDRRRFERQIEHLEGHDPLTGLLNRRGFELELARHVANVKRYGDEGALMMIDLDGFKYLNDSLGHRAGDELIAQVARILSRRLRETDVLARAGGDEFAVLLPRAGAAQAREVANSLLEGIRTDTGVLPSGMSHAKACASIGIALFGPMDALDSDAMMRADLAMYDAKESGGDALAFYSSARRKEPPIKTRLVWAERIRAALRDNQLVLHAQPIVNLRDGTVELSELLLRMVTGDGELVAPASFLSIAEQLDLVQELDCWVVTRAIELASRRGFAGALAVNLSARSIADPRLLMLIERLLATHSVDPSKLVFELTETATIGDVEKVQRFARRLHRLGCRLALDDFGAGFGTFHYVKHVPFDLLKIDGGFIADCRTNPADKLIVESAVRIARGLGKLTVAEHAPNHETLDYLRAQGVDYSQGFITGRPALVQLPDRATIERSQST